MPASFLRLLEERGAEAAVLPSWQFFLGNAYPSSPEEILVGTRNLAIAPFEVPPDASEAVQRFRASDELPRRFQQDPYLKEILQEEVAFLATQSIVLARIKRAFDALRLGGSIAIEGADNYLLSPIREKVRRLGWKRFARKAAVGMSEVWAISSLPSPLREVFTSAVVVFFILDP